MVNIGSNPSHILATSCPADERTRALKHGDTFAVFDHYGDIKRRTARSMLGSIARFQTCTC
jgi:hypothetical protein